MNDPALAAVIFVEQPEGLCGLTKTVRLSTRVISAFTVDREGTNLNMKRLSYFRLRRKATPMIRERTPLGHAMIRCAVSGEGVPASGAGVPAGTRIDTASLKNSNLTEQTFRCPHCGNQHTWSAKDAWVEYVH
jgi:hypothetical protein